MDPEANIMGKTPAVDVYAVLYDGDCPLCRTAVSRLMAWDVNGHLVFIRAQSPELKARFPWLSSEALRTSIHLVGPGKRTWDGAGAVEELVRILPRWRWMAWLFRLPLARPLARGVYRWIARNRYRLRCEDHCGGPTNFRATSRVS
jgi:predicted DCC family thiol-disulfide oxidoreductase YuxK